METQTEKLKQKTIPGIINLLLWYKCITLLGQARRPIRSSLFATPLLLKMLIHLASDVNNFCELLQLFFFFFWFDKINNSNLIHLIPSILTKQIHLEVLLLESGGKDMQTKSVVYQPTKKSSNQGFELQNYQFNINFTSSKNSFCNYFAYRILSYYDIYIVWRIVVYRYNCQNQILKCIAAHAE